MSRVGILSVGAPPPSLDFPLTSELIKSNQINQSG